MSLPPLSYLAAGMAQPVASNIAEGVGEVAGSFLEFLFSSGKKEEPLSIDGNKIAEPGPTESISLDLLREDAAKLLEQFSELFLHRIKQQGIDVHAPINISTAPDGSIKVAGAPSRSQEIESLFAQNQDIADLYHLVEAAHSTLNEMDRIVAAREQFQFDSIATADHFRRNSDANRLDRFHLDVRGGKPSIRFE